ncbi:hypothetical protein ACFLUZ_01280 [Chloroflexota bacterium]
MEIILAVLLCIVLVVFGGMTMSQGFMSSVDSAALSVEEITVARGEIMRTELSLLSARQLGVDSVEVTLSNSGQMKLASFSKWDVIVHYYDADGTYYTKWLPYTEETLDNDEWQKLGIYLDAGAETPEVFEPGILNHGEEMKIEAKLSPPPKNGATVDAIIATPNGIQDSISFAY